MPTVLQSICWAFLLALGVIATVSSATAAIITEFVGTPILSETRTDPYPQAGFGFYANLSGTAQVNELGFWVSPDDAGGVLGADHTVTLYDYVGANTYTAVAQGVVLKGSTADANGYAWVSIPTITLSDTRQGGDYYILTASQGTDTWGPITGTNTWATGNPYFGTRTERGWFDTNTPGGTQDFVNFRDNGGYAGPNIGLASVVPEPATLTIWGLGALGCAFAAYRRKKSAA